MKRSYGQYCAVAKALDVVGERWTLLIVRELLVGPRRYTDLLRDLPGIGTNLLAARLRELEQRGLVRRRTLPPPAGSTVYELTELGEGLREPVLAFGRWGATFLAAPEPGEERRPGWYVLSMDATFDPEAATGIDAAYELRVDGEVFHIDLTDGDASFGQTPNRDPDVVLELDVNTLIALLSSELGPRAALDSGRVHVIEGRPKDLVRLVKIFAWPTGATAAPV